MSDYLGPPRVKTAALGAIAGGISAYRERENLRKIGVPDHIIDSTLTTGGGALRGLGRDLLYGSLGGGLGLAGGSFGAAYQAALEGKDLRRMSVEEKLPYRDSAKRIGLAGAGLGELISAYHQVESEEQRARDALAQALLARKALENKGK